MTKTLADNFDGLVENNKKEIENKAKSYIENMEIKTEKLCDYFLDEEFEPKEMREKLCDYLNERHNRLFYSVISNKIFTMNDDKITIFQGNIDKLLEYVWNDSFEIKENSKADNEEIIKVIIKLRDHVNLARRQYTVLKYTDKELEDKLNEFSKPMEMRITKEMSIQLITLVGIFTAIAFVVFGGISSLEAVFSNISRSSLLAVVIAGCIWSLCITDLIFIFMFQLEKITQKEFFTHCEENVFKRYSIVWWSNLVLVIVLLLSSWTYIVLDGRIFGILNQAWLTGVFVILMIFVFVALWLLERLK